MALPIEEVSTITAKGQTTIPKPVRQALGVDSGDVIAFRVDENGVSVRRAETEHRDPAIGSFLKLIEDDIAGGRNVRPLPADTLAAMRRLLAEVPADAEEPIEGDVAI